MAVWGLSEVFMTARLAVLLVAATFTWIAVAGAR